MKKPPYISHYLVLRDLLNGVNVKEKVSSIHYLCSSIRNIKYDIKKQGIDFLEDRYKETSYSHYKLYVLNPSRENIEKAKNLLKKYETENVINFLGKEKTKTEETKINETIAEIIKDLANDIIECNTKNNPLSKTHKIVDVTVV